MGQVSVRIGLVAGESSGDLLGSGLINAIRSKVPDAVFEGVAGPAMLAAGCGRWANSEDLAVMGLIEPLKEIPRLLRLRKELIRRWQESPPDVFVGIDAPDFNLGLETALKASGIRTVHYVSPSVWAWRPGRIEKVRRAADCVLCILPFEKKLYDDNGISAVFVGHPKADSIRSTEDIGAARRSLGLDVTGRVVAVLPGSRDSEVSRLAGVFAEASRIISRSHDDVRFVTPVATPRLRQSILASIRAAGVEDRFSLLDGRSDAAMAAANVVLLASGTAALESALHGKPTVAAYRVSPLTYAILWTFNLIKLTHFTLPNLLTEEPLVPELIQNDATPEALAREVNALLDDEERCAGIHDRFVKLRSELALGADCRAATAVLELAAR